MCQKELRHSFISHQMPAKTATTYRLGMPYRFLPNRRLIRVKLRQLDYAGPHQIAANKNHNRGYASGNARAQSRAKMKTESGTTISVWATTANIPSRPPLDKNARANVCVVGAGIAGMTTAYLLARAGKSVVVLDDGPIGGGMTGRTTAHLVTAFDDRYFQLERLHGEKGSRLAAESHAAAIDQIERIVREEKIDCEFERLDGYLFVPPGESKQILDRELKAAHRAGLTDIEMVGQAPIESYDTGKALRFPRQAQ